MKAEIDRKDKVSFKYQWRENIKPLLMFMIVGAALVAGMRLAEIAWPETAAKVMICFANDLNNIEACKSFKNDSQ